jgi:hypothetical protein
MTDEDRIIGATNLFMQVLRKEAPLCPICGESMTLDDDFIRIGADLEEDYPGTLTCKYYCEECYECEITLNIVTVNRAD